MNELASDSVSHPGEADRATRGGAMSRANELVQPECTPRWLGPLLDGLGDVDAATLSRHRIAPPADGRRSAVLILFGDDPATGPDVLLTERAST